MGSALELEHNKHWMSRGGARYIQTIARQQHDLSRQKLVQDIHGAITRQNEKCMTFRDISLRVVGSIGTKFLSTGCACKASNKFLITRSGKYGRKKERRTTMTVERR